MNRFLYWAPRVLCILFGVFLSLFSLDVFQAGSGAGEILLGLLIHLAPVFLVALTLAVSWRREWVGAVVFTALAVLYPVSTGGRQHWAAYASISGSLFLIGVLFLMNWVFKRRSPGQGSQPGDSPTRHRSPREGL